MTDDTTQIMDEEYVICEKVNDLLASREFDAHYLRRAFSDGIVCGLTMAGKTKAARRVKLDIVGEEIGES